MQNKTVIRWLHTLGAISLGLFFMYAGAKKFIPKDRPLKPETVALWQQEVASKELSRPTSFQLSMRAFRSSGFFYLIGSLQLLSGLLMFWPSTRLLGLVVLLPVTINIFTMHVFMDNRMDENVETGLWLLLNVGLMMAYWPQLKSFLNTKVQF